MPTKKSQWTQKILKSAKNDKKNVKKTPKKTEKNGKSDLQKNIKLANEDRMLEKVEKYVDRNREKTSQEILKRKNKRGNEKYQKWDLELLISRVNVESKPSIKTKEISKLILYIIYALIIIAILIFFVKFFFAWNMPQNW